MSLVLPSVAVAGFLKELRSPSPSITVAEVHEIVRGELRLGSTKEAECYVTAWRAHDWRPCGLCSRAVISIRPEASWVDRGDWLGAPSRFHHPGRAETFVGCETCIARIKAEWEENPKEEEADPDTWPDGEFAGWPKFQNKTDAAEYLDDFCVPSYARTKEKRAKYQRFVEMHE